MSVRRTVTRNTLFNGAGRVWEALVSLALVAYIVSELGLSQYGLWGVVGAFTGYAALFDVGFGSAYAKYIAEYAAKEDRGRISGVVSTGLFFYLLFGAVFVAVGWWLVGLGVGLVERIDPEIAGDLGDASTLETLGFLLRWGFVLVAVANCIAPFTAVQTGLQRMGITNAIGFVVSIVKIGATVGFLEAGYGIRGLLYTNAIVLACFGVASIVVAFRICPGLQVSAGQVNREMLRRLVGFGWRAQVSRLSNLVMFETDVLVIMLVLRDLQLAGLYKVGVELANKMRQVPGVMLSALVPAVSELDARDEQARLSRLYVTSTRYVAALCVPLVAFLAGSSGLLMKAWQGTALELGVAVVVLRIMAVGYLANMLPGAGVSIALGKGRPEVQMYAGLISMLSNIALTFALVYTIGFWGVPIATAVSMYLSWAWFARAMERVADVSAGALLRRALFWPMVASIPGFLFCLASEFFARDLTGRVESLAGVAVVAGVFGIFYLGMLRRTPFFDESDLEYFDTTLGLRRVPGYRAWSRSMRGE